MNIVGLFYAITTMNNTIIKSLGKSKLFLYIKLVQRLVGLSLVIWGASYSILGLLIGVISSVVFNYIVTTSVNKKLLGYGIFEQIADVGTSLLLASILGGITYYIASLCCVCSQYIVMVFQIVFYIFAYLVISKFTKIPGYMIFEEVVMDKFLNKSRK